MFLHHLLKLGEIPTFCIPFFLTSILGPKKTEFLINTRLLEPKVKRLYLKKPNLMGCSSRVWTALVWMLEVTQDSIATLRSIMYCIRLKTVKLASQCWLKKESNRHVWGLTPPSLLFYDSISSPSPPRLVLSETNTMADTMSTWV